MRFITILLLGVSLAMNASITSAETDLTVSDAAAETNILEELNPFDPNIEEILEEYDRIYEEETGLPAHIFDGPGDGFEPWHNKCYRDSCPVYVRISKAEQRAYLYLNGRHTSTWKVSTGMKGYTTPNMDRHPNGRIYNRYTSTRFPGGDYKGLGNMPYAIFIRGGFAIHGTPQSNWPLLGRRASHGCVRVHPDYAQYLNQLVRSYGVRQVWFTIH